MAIWDQFITERDRQVFGNWGGRRQGFGQRPAILIIDMYYGAVGETPRPILESIKAYPNSCGLEGWQAISHIERLLKVSRARGLPIFFTTYAGRPSSLLPEGRGKGIPGFDPTSGTSTRGPSVPANLSPAWEKRSYQIVEQIAPLENEILLTKPAPSAFFCTPLIAYLTSLQVDSLIVCGESTSGCVRATVVDAFSHGLKVAVVEECTFDRGQASHAIGLFDMHAKYADVVLLQEAESFLGSLPPGLFPTAGTAPGT